MLYGLAADAVLVLHLLFVVAVPFGGLAWLWWRWAPLIHLPVAGWGAYVEIAGRPCPLTTLENHLLAQAGDAGYGDSFIGHYLLAALYPEGLTREAQWALAGLVVVVNLIIYARIRQRRHRAAGDRAARR
ncbi:MAG: DUF2784 domain-containing protein [Pseudomonadota bacterium]